MKAFHIGASIFLFVFCILLVCVTCKKDNSNPPPALPPLNSFIVDFSDFTSSSTGTLPQSLLKSTEVLSNYQAAALTVSYWNSILYLNTAIPAACFKEAFNHKGIYITTNTWEWNYSVADGANTITSRLQAILVTDSVKWKMYISASGDSLSLTDFLWITGTSSLAGTGGSWILNESPAIPNPLFSINWSRDNNLSGSIQYTYVKPGTDATGNYIKFETKDTALTLDHFYFIHKERPVNFDTKIQWNARTKAGRYYDINGWHCWDSGKLDVACN